MLHDTCRAGSEQEVFSFMAEDGAEIRNSGGQNCSTGVDGTRSSTTQSAEHRLTAGDGQEKGSSARSTADPRSENVHQQVL